MDQVVSLSTARQRFNMLLMTVFGGAALLLAAIGIYGVLACSMAERTHEIGIRMAIGASKQSIVGMVLRRTLLLAGAGVASGALGAVAVTRVLKTFLFEVKPTDPVTFTVVASLLMAVAFLAGWIPARRASSVDPVIALRCD